MDGIWTAASNPVQVFDHVLPRRPKLVLLLCVFAFITSIHRGSYANVNQWDKCPTFCGLTGEVPDSTCSIAALDSFNRHIQKILLDVADRPFFRYYRTQFYRPCEFWISEDRCFGQGCAVEACDNLPDLLRRSWDRVELRYTESECSEDDPLGKINMTRNIGTKGDPMFCTLSTDENDENSVFVDLKSNPERFTGYGKSAWRIWSAIYHENCFWSNQSDSSSQSCARSDDREPDHRENNKSNAEKCQESCLENRVFYNAISGLHTSINVHLCANYFFPGSVIPGRWGYNLLEFNRRFGSMETHGAGPRFLKNLYFLYLIQMKALIKASPYLRTLDFDDEDICLSSTDKGADPGVKMTQTRVIELLDLLETIPCEFNETEMFQNTDGSRTNEEINDIRDTFSQKFINISRIIDCVGCDKCRMWGRLQIKGIGTAFNILFHQPTSHSFNSKLPRLPNSDIIALVNSFSRSSSSISHISYFRKMSNEDFKTEL